MVVGCSFDGVRKTLRPLLVLVLLATLGGELRADLEVGDPLTLLLQQLQSSGVTLAYSSEFIQPSMRVRAAVRGIPTLDDARRELARFGLELAPVGPNTFVIKRKATTTTTLRGTVGRMSDGQPIPGALVVWSGGKGLTAHTDRRGFFELTPLAAGRGELLVEAFSYQSWRRAVDLDGSAADGTTIEVRLQPQIEILEEVVVTPDQTELADERMLATTTRTGADLEQLPLRAGESFTAIESVPGIAIGADQAAPRIRGAGDRDTLVILDGFELYEPYHLPDFRSPFSLVDPQAVGQIEVQTGGMPVEYGDRAGGLIRIETQSNRSAPLRSISLGSANARAAWGGANSSGGFWTASLRYWEPNAVTRLVNLGDDEIDPRLLDLFAKIEQPVGDKQLLALHLLAGDGRLDFLAPERDERVRADVSSRYLWGRWIGQWSDRDSTETVVGLGFVHRLRSGRVSTTGEPNFRVRDARRLRALSLTQRWVHTAGERHRLSAGLEARRLSADYDYSNDDLRLPGSAEPIHLSPAGTSLALFVSDRFRAGSKVVIETGARLDRQGYLDENQFSPRLNVAWQLSTAGLLRASFGRYSQSQRIHELEIEDRVTQYAKTTDANQFSVSWESSSPRGWRCRVGAFMRWQNNPRARFENLYNTVEILPEARPDRVRIDPERARARGLELSLDSPRGTQRWHGRLAYSLSRAEERERSVWVPVSWDQTHALTANATLRLGAQVELTLAGYARTGWPTTPIGALDLTAPVSGPRQVDPHARNSERRPDYLRLDARLAWTRPLRRGAFRLDATVSNATDRKNECCSDVKIDSTSGNPTATPEFWVGYGPQLTATWSF